MGLGRDFERERLIRRVLLYHEQTKHASQAYARSIGRMDWATQPNPFRHYAGAPLSLLPRTFSDGLEDLCYDQVCQNLEPAQELNRESLSAFFYYSLALSAWKDSGQASWSLRVNPSSGNLHPTEAYVLAGPVKDFSDAPMIAHYDPYHHGLEERFQFSVAEWNQLSGALPRGCFLVGLASIPWRESWKYGERAYRYCQIDIGHAIACLRFAAMMLGWEMRAIESLDSAQIETLCGVLNQKGAESELGAGMFAVFPRGEFPLNRQPVLQCGEGFFRALREREWKGSPNNLSPSHHEWPILSFVNEAVEGGEWTPPSAFAPGDQGDQEDCASMQGTPGPRPRTVRAVVRGRRSAVAMDGLSSMAVDDFYRLLCRLSPRLSPGISVRAEFGVHVALLLFVHRVSGLSPGLYMHCRSRRQKSTLTASLRDDFEWSQPLGCPPELELYLLKSGDFQEVSRMLSCHQSIASDGAFSVAMLAEFAGPLHEQGPGLYPRLYWETGEIGQWMYLEAEAAGLQATGIGCFLDDGVHQLLGIADPSWQSLYHFTVGGALKDERVMVRDAYHHLTPRVVDS